MSSSPVTIKAVEMPEEMRRKAVTVTLDALRAGSSTEKDIAGLVKKQFDKIYGPCWHCVVGKNFGSYVTHENERFIYMYIDHMAILLFKSA